MYYGKTGINLVCFFIFLEDIGLFCGTTDTPILVMSPFRFKARVGSALFELSGGVCVTLHVPRDSPLVQLLLTSLQPAWHPVAFLPA